MAGEFTWISDFGATAGALTYDIVTFLLIVALVVMVGGFLLWYLSYRHIVVVRYITKTRKFVIMDKARVTKEDGVPCWKLLKMKATVRPPGPEAIEITKRGKFLAECYWSEDNPSPNWLEDTGNPQDAFNEHAYTSDERAFAVSQHMKSMAKRHSSLWEKIMQIALPAAMIVIVAIPFVFWGELTSSSVEVTNAQADMTKQMESITEQNARLLSIMAGKLEIGELVIEQDIPPDYEGGGGSGE